MEFKIRSSGKECIECRKRFQEGEKFFSLLKFDSSDLPIREDRCEACWKPFNPPEDSVWWLTRRRKPKDNKPKIDFESVIALFFKLLKEEKKEFHGLKYVTALLLLRKKKLKLIGFSKGDDLEFMEVKPRGKNGNTVYKIPVPVLSEEDLEALKERLKENLTLSP